MLASLSGRADALKKQLEAHSSQLRKNIDRLLKQQNSGDTDCDSVSQKSCVMHHPSKDCQHAGNAGQETSSKLVLL